jgi:orotate phosphoribosyltransferase
MQMNERLAWLGNYFFDNKHIELVFEQDKAKQDLPIRFHLNDLSEEAYNVIADSIATKLAETRYDLIVGIPENGSLITRFISQKFNIPVICMQSCLLEDDNSKVIYEGLTGRSENVIVIGDLIMRPEVALEAYRELEATGFKVCGFAALYQQSPADDDVLAYHGLPAYTVKGIFELLEQYVKNGRIAPAQRDFLIDFLQSEKRSPISAP